MTATRMTRTIRRLTRLGVAACAAALLSGCMQLEVPLVTDETRANNETLEEQRAWVAEQLDLATGASGVAEGWYDIYWQDVFWSESRPDDKELLRGVWLPEECGSNGAGQIEMSLKNIDVEDPLAAAARVRNFWEAEGWTVTDVLSYETPESTYFRADRPDGAVLALQAAAEGMSLEVASACSLHNTVTNWADSVGEPNVFQEELDRREKTGS